MTSTPTRRGALAGLFAGAATLGAIAAPASASARIRRTLASDGTPTLDDVYMRLAKIRARLSFWSNAEDPVITELRREMSNLTSTTMQLTTLVNDALGPR